MLPAPLLLTLALISSLATQAAPAKSPQPEPRPTLVKTYTVRADLQARDASAVGQLLADETVVIRPEVAGRVTGLHFSEGGAVKKGQTLVTLDSAEARARVRQLEAAANLAREKHQRAENLFAQQFLSEQAVIEAREILNQARAQVDEARSMLAKTVIRAPFAGVAGLRQVSPGAYLKEGEDIVTLTKLDPLKLDLRIPERYLPLIRQARGATATVEAWPGERFSATLYAVDPSVDPATRTLLVRARVPNQAGKLKPGMFARVEIPFAGTRDRLRIPEEALAPKAGKQLVYRVVDGKAVATPVKLGQRQPGWVEVLQGLAAGDVIVTEGQLKLRPGAPVQPAGTPAPAAGRR